MELLHFAHRGEAQSFIKALNLKSLDDTGNFYGGNQHYLLISGEGHTDTLIKLSYYIAKYCPKIIVNLGIAGSVNEQVKPGEIYPIRTAYFFMDGEPVFQSFTTSNESSMDCITSHNRILDDKLAIKLGNFAQIVDRELWAVGKVSQNLKIPFYSYKLISDYAGHNTQCFDLKARALEFSQRLLEYYLEQTFFKNNLIETTDLTLPFHASFTQKKKIEKLTHKINDLDLINNILESGEIKNANHFISELEDIINPINKHLRKHIERLIHPLESIGAQILIDKNLDQKKIKLQMEINSQTNIDNLKKQLDHFKFSDFENLWNGEIDV